MGRFPIVILLLFGLLLILYGIISVSFKAALAIAAGIVIFFLSFVSVEFALYILIFSMLLSPEIVIASTPAREITLRMEDLLLPILILGWMARIAVYKDVRLFTNTPVNKPVIFYLLISLFSTTIGFVAGRVVLTSGFFFLLKYVEYFLIFYMVLNYVKDEDQIRKISRAMLLTSFLVSLYAIYQIPAGERVSAPFEGRYGGEPNTLGGYLVLMISITLGLLLNLKERWKRSALGGLLILQFIPLLFTLSRSSWLGLIPMYGVLLILSEKKKELLLGGTLVVLSLFIFTPSVVSERYSSTFEESPGFQRTVRIGRLSFDPSASERILGFKSAISAWKKKPVLGYGITGKGFIDGQYFRLLVEVGLVGLTAFLFLVYKIIKSSLHVYNSFEDPYIKGLTLGFIAGTVGILAHAVGTNSFIIVRIMEPYWLFAGLILSAYRIYKYQPQHVLK